MTTASKRFAGFAISIALFGIGGCATRGEDTAGGAVLGGVAGSVLTGGSAAGTVGGAVVGGVVGNEAGKGR
jgi:osmotically inducible lipoprotein OsmB